VEGCDYTLRCFPAQVSTISTSFGALVETKA
jgi:hypothetical protein